MNAAMKKFLKNLSFGVEVKLYVPPLMYTINAYNMSDVRSQAVILSEVPKGNKFNIEFLIDSDVLLQNIYSDTFNI